MNSLIAIMFSVGTEIISLIFGRLRTFPETNFPISVNGKYLGIPNEEVPGIFGLSLPYKKSVADFRILRSFLGIFRLLSERPQYYEQGK